MNPYGSLDIGVELVVEIWFFDHGKAWGFKNADQIGEPDDLIAPSNELDCLFIVNEEVWYDFQLPFQELLLIRTKPAEVFVENKELAFLCYFINNVNIVLGEDLVGLGHLAGALWDGMDAILKSIAILAVSVEPQGLLDEAVGVERTLLNPPLQLLCLHFILELFKHINSAHSIFRLINV